MKYRIVFEATVEREVDMPNDFNWHEAYVFCRDQLGWYDLAHSAAAEITINTTKTLEFRKIISQ